MTLLEAYLQELFGEPLSNASDNSGSHAGVGIVGPAGENVLTDIPQEGPGFTFGHDLLLNKEID
jgi:hypothetical protein